MINVLNGTSVASTTPTSSSSSSSTTSSTSSSSSSSTSSASSTRGTLGKNDFMNLLIEQMKNQDPMNPMDSSQFAAQLAQFSSLEQLQNLNTSMTQSINANYLLTQSINNTLSSTLIGKEAKISGGNITINGQSSMQLGYNLPSDASSVTVNIYDANGSVVKSYTQSPVSAGDNSYKWDMTDNNGSRLPDGSYTFKVSAKAMNGSDETATQFIYGVISGVKFTDQGTKLSINNSDYNLSDIMEIVNPGSNGGN